MRKQVGAVVLAASVAAGVATGVAVNAATSGQPSPAARTSAPTNASVTPTARPVAEETPAETPGVEVRDPVLVTNTDGTATLSATLINRTRGAVFINSAYGSEERSPTGLLVYGLTSEAALPPGVPMTIGGTSDAYRIRTRERANEGVTYRVTLEFSGEGTAGASPVTIEAPVVARTSRHDGIADNESNTAITVVGGVVVVVPGQEKAYIGGRVSSTIQDQAYDLPTAVDARGRSVAWFHQTATGGPFSIGAPPKGDRSFTTPPYLDDDTSEEADYFLAKDVTVGEAIMVTIRFGSGDVVAPFKVVRGNPDGTI